MHDTSMHNSGHAAIMRARTGIREWIGSEVERIEWISMSAVD
jgi:hypothetical protein